MMAAYVLMFKWLLAGVGCVLAGLAMCGVLKAAVRAWPALAARRNAWLAAQIVVACAALLPFLPRGGQIRVAPAFTFDARASAAIGGLSLRDDGDEDAGARAQSAEAAAPAASAAPAAPGQHGPANHKDDAFDADHARHDPAASPRPAPLDAPATTASRLLLALPMLWVALYAIGLAHALIKLRHARALWRRLLAAARQLSPQALTAHGAFDAQQLSDIAQGRLAVMETDAALSPVLIGWRRPVLLLPRHLREFSVEQQRMIVAHELHHWRSGDPLCLGAAAALQTIFWFNPALRWLGAKMTWALELACDQHVLAGRPQLQRKLYASALLRQWKTQTTTLPLGAVAFGGLQGAFKGDSIAARLLRMQQTSPPTLNTVASWTLALVMAAVLAAGAVLQPALAFNTGPQGKAAAGVADIAASLSISTPTSASNSASTSAPSPLSPLSSLSSPSVSAAWRHPLDKMRVSGFFGVWRKVSDKPHQGIDLAAPTGTPVHAAAAGKVLSAGPLAENDGRYGTAIIVDNGSVQTLYAHLNSVAVKAGERVDAGQLIGVVGATGFATGPHLHFEVRRDDRAVDPATVLADLDAHATRRALKVRREQQGY
jgi:murein DD-endopeptidase MepM/ murein hydrolase activator NlpD